MPKKSHINEYSDTFFTFLLCNDDVYIFFYK